MMETATIIILLILPFINWPVAIILVRMAYLRPHIRALTERAVLGVVIAIITTVFLLIAVNSHFNFPVLDLDQARMAVRVLIIALGLYPVWWLWSYSAERFREVVADRGHTDTAEN